MSRSDDPADVRPDYGKPPLTDSPWFWVAAFCAAAMMFLMIMAPQYAARQRRLEMQFLAREEIVRRQAAGEGPRPTGQEGAARPPAVGELIIPLWPLWVPTSLLFLLAAYFLWRTRRKPPHAVRAPQDES